jgi:MFS family permease
MRRMSSPAERPTRRVFGLFEWPARVTSDEKRSLFAGGLGWMLDAMDVTLYTLVLKELQEQLGMDNQTAGGLASLTLAASAVGGLMFGFLADRIGRARSLTISILVYSVASGACGFSQGIVDLALFRTILGLGMGGEWTTGAALIAETWPARHRAKALGLMQSSWAIGEMLAAFVVWIIGTIAARSPGFSDHSWRAVFFVGIAPALLCFWIRRDVPEPRIWRERKAQAVPGAATSLRRLLEPGIRRNAILATAMNVCGMFGYWGLFTWIPAYLRKSEAEGGRGLTLVAGMTWFVVMCVGKFFGYALFGFLADRYGRRRTYFTYLFVAALLVPAFAYAPSAGWLLLLGPLVAFFGTGFFSGFSALASELFPTEIRATAMGLSYNLGRGLSASAPWIVGAIADRVGHGAGKGSGLAFAFLFLASMYLAAAILSLMLPDSKGRELD